MATKQDFDLPLRNYIEIDRDGYASFCYPYETGAFISIVNHADGLAQDVLRSRGKYKTAAIKRLAVFIAESRADHELIHRQWDEVLGKRRAERDAQKASERILIAPEPESDAAYRERILDAVDFHDDQIYAINIAIGAELDKIGKMHFVKRFGI